MNTIERIETEAAYYRELARIFGEIGRAIKQIVEEGQKDKQEGGQNLET